MRVVSVLLVFHKLACIETPQEMPLKENKSSTREYTVVEYQITVLNIL